MSSHKELAQSTLQLNREHQYALKVYSEKLEAELVEVDKLLDAAEVDEEDSPFHIAGSLYIQGAERPVGLLAGAELILENSPFHDDAARRQRYINLTEIHPMRPKEMECLAEAVRMENYRLRAYDAQRRGLQPFPPPNVGEQDLEQNTIGIDWERVASKVAAEANSVNVERSAKECEIRWLGDRHPCINHSPWTSEEISKAKSLVEGLSEGDVDWVDVAAKLGTGRTPIDVMRQTIVRKPHVWDAESDKRLIDAVNVYGLENWPLVARMVSEDATPSACQNRYCRSLDPTLMKGGWSEEEDEKLRLAVAVWGNSWVDVASVMAGRTNEQCRDRYTDKLNPTIIRGKWTPDEDANLRAAVDEIGEGRWKKISQKLASGRTDNMCRQRYEVIKRMDAEDEAPKPSGSGANATRLHSSKKKATSTGTSRSRLVQSRKRRRKPASDSDSNSPSEVDEPRGSTETSPTGDYRSDGPATETAGKTAVAPRPIRRAKTVAADIIAEAKAYASEQPDGETAVISSSDATTRRPHPCPRPKKAATKSAPRIASSGASPAHPGHHELTLPDDGREDNAGVSGNLGQAISVVLEDGGEGEEQEIREKGRKPRNSRKRRPSADASGKHEPFAKRRKVPKQKSDTSAVGKNTPTNDDTAIQEGLTLADAEGLPRSSIQNLEPSACTETGSKIASVGSRRKQPSRAARSRVRIAQDEVDET